MSAAPQQPTTWVPVQARPLMSMRRVNWVTIAGAILALIALIVIAISSFMYAIAQNIEFETYRLIEWIQGVGTLLEGVGLFLAFLGLATERRF